MPYALRDDAKLLRWLKLEAFAAPEGTQKESHLYTVPRRAGGVGTASGVFLVF